MIFKLRHYRVTTCAFDTMDSASQFMAMSLEMQVINLVTSLLTPLDTLGKGLYGVCVSLSHRVMGNAYFGSKATAGLCQALIALMPPHSVYIETHLGGGAIMRRKPGALRSIGIDLDERALAGFECEYPVELVHGCCHRFLREYPFDGTELVYSDPPYLHSTRKSSQRYRHDYEVEDHEALLALLMGLPCSVILSGYPSALYDERLEGWRSLSIQVMNQAGVVTENLWFNFEPDRVHWASFAGRNFTDRQRIKRKAASWGRRYRAMPPAERLAVLAAVMAVEAE